MSLIMIDLRLIITWLLANDSNKFDLINLTLNGCTHAPIINELRWLILIKFKLNIIQKILIN